ncbi:MAG TPA: hypothetical protein VKA94_08565 [Hyphomicrobiales bacterium]|nr:hypothetical protein [Hyphomicrobiales bacterium]
MKLRFVILAAIMTCASTQAALADRIDGTWCSPDGKSVSVDGPRVTTSHGNAVDANYNRHHIDYTIPAGEPDEGDQFRADQLNDNQIMVVLFGAGGEPKGEAEIWTQCKPVS